MSVESLVTHIRGDRSVTATMVEVPSSWKRDLLFLLVSAIPKKRKMRKIQHQHALPRRMKLDLRSELYVPTYWATAIAPCMSANAKYGCVLVNTLKLLYEESNCRGKRSAKSGKAGSCLRGVDHVAALLTVFTRSLHFCLKPFTLQQNGLTMTSAAIDEWQLARISISFLAL